jgi:molybdenum cofactor cytidylyltransferase
MTTARAAVILAAGASRRMGVAKAELPFSPFRASAHPSGAAASAHAGHPCTFLSRVIDLARVGCEHGPIVVVGRSQGAPPQPTSTPVVQAVNPHPERGMFSSVQVGLRVVSDAAGTPVTTMLFLVDHPLVQPRTVAWLWALVDRAAPAPADDTVLVPVYTGRRGHPVVLSPQAVRCALEAPADARLDRLLERLAVLEVRVGDPGVIRDIDTPERYRRFFGPLQG